MPRKRRRGGPAPSFQSTRHARCSWVGIPTPEPQMARRLTTVVLVVLLQLCSKQRRPPPSSQPPTTAPAAQTVTSDFDPTRVTVTVCTCKCAFDPQQIVWYGNANCVLDSAVQNVSGSG
eukprot:2987591-Rhodomonas_salina.1